MNFSKEQMAAAMEFARSVGNGRDRGGPSSRGGSTARGGQFTSNNSYGGHMNRGGMRGGSLGASRGRGVGLTTNPVLYPPPGMQAGNGQRHVSAPINRPMSSRSPFNPPAVPPAGISTVNWDEAPVYEFIYSDDEDDEEKATEEVDAVDAVDPEAAEAVGDVLVQEGKGSPVASASVAPASVAPASNAPAFNASSHAFTTIPTIEISQHDDHTAILSTNVNTIVNTMAPTHPHANWLYAKPMSTNNQASIPASSSTRPVAGGAENQAPAASAASVPVRAAAQVEKKPALALPAPGVTTFWDPNGEKPDEDLPLAPKPTSSMSPSVPAQSTGFGHRAAADYHPRGGMTMGARNESQSYNHYSGGSHPGARSFSSNMLASPTMTFTTTRSNVAPAPATHRGMESSRWAEPGSNPVAKRPATDPNASVVIDEFGSSGDKPHYYQVDYDKTCMCRVYTKCPIKGHGTD